MVSNIPIGCNGLQEAIAAGFVQSATFYVGQKGEETDWFLALEHGDDPRFFTLNYCPFCGTRLTDGKPTCGGYGVRKEVVRDVPR